jgi:hypothetical protein
MTQAIITGVLGLGVLAAAAWLKIRGRDPDVWPFVALILIMVSCSAAGDA